MAQIDPLLEEILKRKGSDLHLIAGDPPRIRRYGDLAPLRPEALTADIVKSALYEIMPRKAIDRFEAHDGADFAYALPGHGRFRVNVMRQLAGMGGVFRAIPSSALTLEQLKMPPAVHQLCRASNGLILVTGKTGSGKSTSLAAMIDDLNKRIKGHIVTVEDPIEFVHPRHNCLISQREIGAHTPGFSQALMMEVRKRDIRVIAVCPGSVNTAFFDGDTPLQSDREKILRAEDVTHVVLEALELDERATVSELDIRPTNP
jgi:twitching motility protein PilT